MPVLTPVVGRPIERDDFNNHSHALTPAATADALTTPRLINGVAFDGSANITINAVDVTSRVPATRSISTTAPLSGGGNLSGDLTLTISAATTSNAGTMSAADKTKLDAITGTNTGDQTNITGNAGTATALQTARLINGVSFNGTGNITINAVDSTARAAAATTISTTAPLTGGGDLSTNRTFAITAASGVSAGSMSSADFTKLAAITGTNTGDETYSTITTKLAGGSGGGTTNFLRADGTFAAPPGGGGGSGTVTSVSVTTANGVSGSVATATTTPAITLTLGAITPSSVKVGAGSVAIDSTHLVSIGNSGANSALNIGQDTTHNLEIGWDYNATPASAGCHIAVYGYSNDLKVDARNVILQQNSGGNVGIGTDPGANKFVVSGNIVCSSTISASNFSGTHTGTSSGTNTGDQTITLTGNVTGTGTGSFATTIAAGAVTLANMANVATGTVFYRKTAATGAPEVQTLATLKTDLGLTGTNSGDQTTITGNAGSATVLQTARTINGVSFNGSANISVNTNNALTLSNAGSGAASGTTFNGGAAVTVSYNSIGAAPATPQIQSVTSSATVTPTFSNDQVNITAQAAALNLANPTGTAVDGWGIAIRIKDNATAQTITYGTQYRAIGVTLPTTTVISKTLYLGMIYNAADTKWDVVSVAQEA